MDENIADETVADENIADGKVGTREGKKRPHPVNYWLHFNTPFPSVRNVLFRMVGPPKPPHRKS